jgi:glycosyltransferase involved in cell wall biosynthesis
MPLRAVHCPVNFAGIPSANVRALRRRGVDATLIVFSATPFRRDEPDLNLQLEGKPLWRRQLVQWRTFLRELPRTGVFHFYFGLTLVPRRLQFPLLELSRRRSVFHFLGSDIRGKKPEELAYAAAAGARIVGSYDAARWLEDVEVVPPGIELDRFSPAPPPGNRRPLVVHAPSSTGRKGTEHVVAACASLPVELEIVHGLPNAEALDRYRAADIVVDQLRAGWYGIFAIEAMALGKPVVTFLHEDAVGRTEEAFGIELPIVSASADDLREKLGELVEAGPEEWRRRGAASRVYVERVHDADRMADRLLEIYGRL